MRLLHIHTAYSNAGGVERYLATTIPRLEEVGVHNTVLVARVVGGEEQSRVPVMHLPALTGSSAATAENRRRQVVSVVRELRPDVIMFHHLEDHRVIEWLSSEASLVHFVHSQYPLVCPGDSKFLKTSRTVCPRRVGPFCVIAPWLQNCSSRRPRTHLKLLLTARRSMSVASAHVSLFVVASSYMRSELLLNDYAAARIAVVPLGTEDPREHGDPPASDSADRRPMVLFAGRMTRHKGADLLVQAMHAVRTPANLVLAGFGPEVEAVERAGRSLPLRHNFMMTGPLDPSALSARYDRAAVIVVPSMWAEPFGLVGIEAMAHGRPVIAFDRGGVRQWLEHDVTGLAVRGGDIQALGEAIDRVLTDRALAAALGAAGRSRFLSHFTARGHAERLRVALAAVTGNAPELGTRSSPVVGP